MPICMKCGEPLTYYYCYNCGAMPKQLPRTMPNQRVTQVRYYFNPAITGVIYNTTRESYKWDLLFTNRRIIATHFFYFLTASPGIQMLVEFVSDHLAKRRRRKIGDLSPDGILNSHKYNFEMPYQYIEGVKLNKRKLFSGVLPPFLLTFRYQNSVIKFNVFEGNIELAVVLINYYLQDKIGI